MMGRLIVALISNLLEQVALVVIVLVGLPMLDIHISIPGLITLMIVWAVVSVVIYRLGSRALRRKPVITLPVISSRGKVVSPLAPEGLIRIKSELWIARTDGRKINSGTEVIVVEQDGLKLVVRKSNIDDLKEPG